MNKDEMIKAFRKRLGWSREQDARAAIDALFGPDGIIAGELAAGGTVKVSGFGSFEAQPVAARTYRNPKTVAEVEVLAHRRPVFHSSKALKARVAG